VVDKAVEETDAPARRALDPPIEKGRKLLGLGLDSAESRVEVCRVEELLVGRLLGHQTRTHHAMVAVYLCKMIDDALCALLTKSHVRQKKKPHFVKKQRLCLKMSRGASWPVRRVLSGKDSLARTGGPEALLTIQLRKVRENEISFDV
jgi:hypothetical protein